MHPRHSTHPRHGSRDSHLLRLTFPELLCTHVQAVAAAVQTTHLLRLLTAVALIMVLRVAKSVMYSGKETSSWQRALVHAYDLPPLVLLTLLQLSAIALPAKIYHDSPSTVPQKVHFRRTCYNCASHLHLWKTNTACMQCDMLGCFGLSFDVFHMYTLRPVVESSKGSATVEVKVGKFRKLSAV